MVFSLVYTLALVIAAVHIAAADVDLAPCTVNLPVNEMTTKADGIIRLLDGRQFKGKVHHVGGCRQQEKYPTGNPYKTNYTMLSYDAGVSTQECIDKKATDGTGIYDSFQAITVEPNGFSFQPELFVDDIDALETDNMFQGQLDSWRESSIVFGIANGAVVQPKVSFISSTKLQRQMFTIPQAALAQMELGALGEINVEGSQFSDSLPPHNCPFAAENEESACRMNVKFESPIEKLVILYAATHKANQDPNAAMFVSQLHMSCSCLCAERKMRGVKYFPAPAKAGVCTRKDEATLKPRYSCDMLATTDLCEYGYISTFERTGPAGGDGLYPCTNTTALTVTSHSEYSPDASWP